LVHGRSTLAVAVNASPPNGGRALSSFSNLGWIHRWPRNRLCREPYAGCYRSGI